MMSSSTTAATHPNCVSFDKRALKLDKPEDAREIIDSINEHAGCLKTLILSGNTMGIEAGEAIGNSLETHKELSHAIWSDMFTGRSKNVIAPALSGLSRGVILSGAQLVELDLRDNAFGPTGVVGVTELIGSRCCHTLKVLRMDNEGLGHQGCRLLTEALTKCLDESAAVGKMMKLEVFTAGRNRLENEGMKMLSGVFQRMQSLRELALYQNGIGIHGVDGCEALARALSQNPNLITLNLSDNSLTPKGIRVLIDCAFESLEKLEVLNLGDCILRSKGAQLLADCLNELLPNLQELYLPGNEIRRDAAVSLALSLQNKQGSLKVLDLNTNELGEDGIVDLQETLSSIELDHCLQSLSEDEGGGDAEDDEENEDDTYEDYEDDDEEEEEEEGGEEMTGTAKAGSNFSFKIAADKGKPTSLFEGLPICSPPSIGSLLTGATPEGGVFSAPAKPTGRGLFGVGAPKPTPDASKSFDFSSNKPASKPSAAGTSLFQDLSLSQNKPASLFGESSSSSSLFKTPTARPSSGLFGTLNSENGGSSAIKPAKFSFAPMTQTIDVNREIDRLLQNPQSSREVAQRLSSVNNLTDEVSKALEKDPSFVAAAVECGIESAAVENGSAMCRALLDAAATVDPVATAGHVLVQLGLIKGEKKMKRQIAINQGQIFLNCLKDSIAKKNFPQQQAELVSFFLSKGPQRPEAETLRKQHKSEIEQLTKSIQESLSTLKI